MRAQAGCISRGRLYPFLVTTSEMTESCATKPGLGKRRGMYGDL